MVGNSTRGWGTLKSNFGVMRNFTDGVLSGCGIDQLLSQGPVKSEELRTRMHVIPEKGNRFERRSRAAKRRKGK